MWYKQYTRARLFVGLRKASGTWVVEVCDSYGKRSRNAMPHFYEKFRDAKRKAQEIGRELSIEVIETNKP